MKKFSIFKHEIPLKAERVESESVSPEKGKDTIKLLAGLTLSLGLEMRGLLENGYFCVLNLRIIKGFLSYLHTAEKILVNFVANRGVVVMGMAEPIQLLEMGSQTHIFLGNSLEITCPTEWIRQPRHDL